jgi:iron complex outermembrane receptor protein
MKTFLTLAVFTITITIAVAAGDEPVAFPVDGVVVDRSGDPIPHATITVDERDLATTGVDGRFSFELEPGTWNLTVSQPAHQNLVYIQMVNGPVSDLRLEMAPAMSVIEAITVSAIRAGDDVPVTSRNLDREEIETLSYGQDFPKLLQYTPSATWYSDSGIGSNYSYFSLRGIQQSRINMTYDGAPLNDPAEHALYFNNFHDFTNAVGSIQVQRGVGTSTVGAPAYGGSVNFASVPFGGTNGGDARVMFGSYGTQRASVAYESGSFGNGFAVSGRASWAETDGYRENSGSEHTTLFLNAGWQGKKSSLKFVSFSGDVETQLAFYAVDPETLAENPRYNPLTEQDRDDFGQDFAQLQYSRVLGEHAVLSASVYYNGADGYFQLWDDPFVQSELFRYGIDQYFVGTMVTNTWNTDRITASVGVHYNDFQGDHTLDIENDRIYLNTGFKQTANAFGKIEYTLGKWLLYGDVQLRWAEFTYEGDIDLGSVAWTFVDPKIGFRRTLSPRTSVYASIGRAQREPGRLDMLAGEDNATVPHDLEAVKPEEVVDFEAGVNLNTPRLGMQANLYAMEFTNEIALTGELSPVGLPVRSNVDDSYRRGLEVDLRWMVSRSWTILHSSNLSTNRIRAWTQYYDLWDDQGNFIESAGVAITHYDVPPLLTPEVTFNLGAEWSSRIARVALIGRYVGESHLDNTGSDDFVAPAFTNLDLQASVDLGRYWKGGRPRITLYVNNLLDDLEQYPSGYSYQFIVRDGTGGGMIDGIPFYYPLAGRNVIAKLELRF